MGRNLAKTYDPKSFEARIYEMWEEHGSFNAEVDRDKKPYCIVMPPPNITGQLHMGHALDQTLQDIPSDGGECRDIVHSGYLAAIMQVSQQRLRSTMLFVKKLVRIRRT